MTTVYLLHFERPIGNPNVCGGTASHYMGYTSHLGQRLEAHRKGNGSALMFAVRMLGVSWVLARTWPGGTRNLERMLKNHGNFKRLCPVCKETKHPDYTKGKCYVRKTGIPVSQTSVEVFGSHGDNAGPAKLPR